MISIKKLTVVRGSNKVLENLDAEFASSKIHGIVGLNGSGKTTLLETLFGFLEFKRGEMLYNNTKLSNKNIAYLEADSFFYPRITGKDYLKIFTIKNRNFDYSKWNELFKLPLNELIDHYSSGMKKKLAFMAVLSYNRPAIILDEPFNSLDLETVDLIKNVLIKLKSRGKLIIVTSHILESLTSICDEIHYLSDGLIQNRYTKDDFDKIDSEVFSLLREQSEQLISEMVQQQKIDY